MWKFADDNKQEISKEKTIEYLEKGKYENLFHSEYKLNEDQICSFTATSGNGVLILCLEKLKNDFENTEGLECILKFLKVFIKKRSPTFLSNDLPLVQPHPF